MHYGSYAAGINGRRVITDKTTGGAVKVQRERASSLDILEVCLFYNCGCATPNAGNVRFCNSNTNFNVMTDEFYWTARACDGVNDCANGQDEVNCSGGRTTARPTTPLPTTPRPTTPRLTTPRPTTPRPTTLRPTTPLTTARPTTTKPNECCSTFQIHNIQFSRVNNNYYISTDGNWKIEKFSRTGRFSMTKGNYQRLGFQQVKGIPVCPTEGKWWIYQNNFYQSYSATNCNINVNNNICNLPGIQRCFKTAVQTVIGESPVQSAGCNALSAHFKHAEAFFKLIFY